MKLAIAQFVLERASFKHQDDYLTRAPNTPIDKGNVDLTIDVARDQTNPNEAAIVRLTATSVTSATYQFEVAYVALFTIAYEDGEAVPEDLDHRLMVAGATMLLPFVRETVASLSGRGRFGPTWLAPTNFAAMAALRPEPVPTAEEAVHP